MWPGAIAATSAAIRRMNPADAARAPDGPTKTTTGAREVIMRDTMRARRIEQSARRSQHQHDQLGAGGIGGVDGVSEVLGSDRLDDAVDLGDDDVAGRRLRVCAQTASTTKQQTGPPQPPSIVRGMAARLYVGGAAVTRRASCYTVPPSRHTQEATCSRNSGTSLPAAT